MLLQSIAVLLWQKQQEQQQTLQLLLPPLLFQSPKGQCDTSNCKYAPNGMRSM